MPGSRIVWRPGLETKSPGVAPSARLVRIVELFEAKGHDVAPPALFKCPYHAAQTLIGEECWHAIDDGVDDDGARSHRCRNRDIRRTARTSGGWHALAVDRLFPQARRNRLRRTRRA